MPRQARLDVPGVLQHVIARGIDRGEIFRDDEDRERFVARLSSLLVETDTQCFAWALVPNHFHLLLRPNQAPLSAFMRRLMTGYAVTFNLRHGRSGHVFQNRYKSIVCDEEEYLLALVRYIGLNPLRARLVDDLEGLDRYPWSGHAVLMGYRSLQGQAVDEVLGRFSDRRTDAVRKYHAFVEAGVPLGRQEELTGGGAAPEPSGTGEGSKGRGTPGAAGVRRSRARRWGIRRSAVEGRHPWGGLVAETATGGVGETGSSGLRGGCRRASPSPSVAEAQRRPRGHLLPGRAPLRVYGRGGRAVPGVWAAPGRVRRFVAGRMSFARPRSCCRHSDCNANWSSEQRPLARTGEDVVREAPELLQALGLQR